MTEKSSENRIFTIPNILSAVRILFIPIYAKLYICAESNADYLIAAGVMALSMLTDALDGTIARKCNMISKLGKVLDPVADKLTQATVLVCLTVHFRHSRQFLILISIFLVKELFMLVMGAIAFAKGKMLNGALMAGKVCTTVLFISMAIFMLCPDMHGTAMWVITAICSVAMVISLFAYAATYMGADYGVRLVPIKDEDK